MIFALAVPTMTMAVGCIDDDGPVDDGPKKSGEDDPDFEDPNTEPGTPTDCHSLQDDDEDQPACQPKG